MAFATIHPDVTTYALLLQAVTNPRNQLRQNTGQ